MTKRIVPGTSIELGTIFGIGRNYVEHARELGNAVPEEPLVFLKPAASVLPFGHSFELPKRSARVDYEVELVLLVSAPAKNLSPAQALGVISHVAVGIDFTARDFQEQAKTKGLPWTLAKGLPGFAVLGSFAPAPRTDAAYAALNLSLHVGGELRQQGSVAQMIHSPARLVSYLSEVFTLSPGDLIYTGTPKGVGPVKAGDRLKAQLEGYPTLEFDVRAPA